MPAWAVSWENFFHNGSVPNLWQLLVPPPQRAKEFYVFDTSRPEGEPALVHADDVDGGS